MFEFEFYDNNVSLINKIMKFSLYYFNYSEFNLENSDILYFGAYTLKKEITYIKYSSLTVKECDFIYR